MATNSDPSGLGADHSDPEYMIASVFIAALNHLLQEAEWARRKLARHAGQSARLQLPLGRVDFRVSPGGYLSQSTEEDFSVRMEIPAEILGSLPEGSDAVMKRVRLEGNAEFAESLGFVFRNLRWNVEDDLARHIGDIPARRLHLAGRGLLEWQRAAASRWIANVRDYLVDENPTLVARRDATSFAAQLLELRDDLARLEKRVERLSVRLRE